MLFGACDDGPDRVLAIFGEELEAPPAADLIDLEAESAGDLAVRKGAA